MATNNSIPDRTPALNRIDESYQGAVDLLNTNKSQHQAVVIGGSSELKTSISILYQNTLAKLDSIKRDANDKIASLDPKIEKSDYNKEVKRIKNETVKELGQALADYNINLINKTIEHQNFTKSEKKELKGMIRDLSTNSKKGKVLRLAAGLFEKPWFKKVFTSAAPENQSLVPENTARKLTISEKLSLANRVVKSFDEAIENFEKAAEADIEARTKENVGKTTTVAQGNIYLKINNNRAKALARNSNVVGTNAIYTVGQVFTPKQGAKQIKSYIAQQADLRVRTTFDKEFTLTGSPAGGNTTVNSKFIPLNIEFDQHVTSSLNANRKAGEAVVKVGKFGGIFGNAGASSANRETEHVINGYLNELSVIETSGKGTEIKVEARRVHQVLRHAVNAFRFETNPAERLRVATQMTQELMTASVLISIAESGKSLEEVAANSTAENPWNQSIVSTSLVTPDMIRGLIEDLKNLGKDKDKKLHSSEEKMWRSQFNALQSFHNQPPQSLSLGGVNIFVKYNISSFNTGVNAGANKYALGTLEQWWKARDSIKNINLTTDSIARRLEARLSTGGEAKKPESESDREDLNEIRSLQKDINRLTRTPLSYLGNGNQYELAAKIEVLSNRLADVIKKYPDDVKPSDPKKPHVKVDGITALVNCMSAKDRTGIEVAVAFTFEQMRNEMGHYPTTEEMKRPENQERFVEIYIQMLKEYGGEEVTEINTGTGGYKVTEDAMLYPNAKAWKNNNFTLADIQKHSGTAGA
ncbi:MAG: hypothetical protein WC222_02060 [Parachlamydiales bacterium]|jgi:hypothetical protein